MSKEKIISRMDELLERFQVPEYRERKIKELSKGNQQKFNLLLLF